VNTNVSGIMQKDGSNARRRPTRRHVLTMATALAIPLLPITGKAAPITFPVPTTTILIPPTESSSSSSTSQDETYTGDPFGMTVTWDPSLWQVKYGPTRGQDSIGLVDADVDLNNAAADAYFIQIEYQTDHLWTTVEDMKKNSMFEWFSEGMQGSTVIQQWDTPDVHSWFHTSEVDGKQSLVYIEYSAVDAPNSVWRYVSLSIDSAIFDAARTRTLFAGVTVDNEAIPRAVDADTLITLFGQHAV